MKKKQGLAVRLAQIKWLTKFLSHINVVLYRLSKGRISNAVEGCPVCLVTMKGHRSQKTKTIALMCIEHGADVILVASFGGAEHNPAWYYNLKADPNVKIQVGGVKREMAARLADDTERLELWPLLIRQFPPYSGYQARTQRKIPVFICSPVANQP